MNYGARREGRVRERGVALTKRFASCYLRHVEWRVALEIVGRLNETRKRYTISSVSKEFAIFRKKRKNYYSLRCNMRSRKISNEESLDKFEIKKKKRKD